MLPDTPLCNAFNKRDYKTAEELLVKGEEIPSSVNEFDLRQIHDQLISSKAFSILDILIERKNINTDVYEYDSFDRTIFETMFSYMPADEACLQFLKRFLLKLDNINDEVAGYTLLSYAAQKKAQPEIIQCLVDAGLRTDFKNNAEDSLLAQAVSINMIPEERQLAYLDIFIQAGVDVNEPNIVQQTALHVAVERHKPHLINKLIANGAQPNAQDNKGNSPFYYALAYAGDDTVYDMLRVAELPDFTQTNRDRQTVLSEFMRNISGGEKSIALLERLIDDGADMDQTAPYYSKPLSAWDWAADKPIEILQMLLKKTGKDVNAQDNDGNTLLHKVCAIDTNYSQEKAKELYRKVKLLLEQGADVSITNTKDETALQLASKDNLKTKVVELLLNAKKQKSL